jgi:hypothetical protein
MCLDGLNLFGVTAHVLSQGFCQTRLELLPLLDALRCEA